MALPAISAGLRVATAIAKFAGKKLTKKGKQGYKLSRSLVKSKRVRTAYTNIGKQTKRHLKFYSKVISPQGTQFKNLITRPTFGQKQLFHPGAKPGSKYANVYVDKLSGISPFRKKLAKYSIIGGIGYAKAKS